MGNVYLTPKVRDLDIPISSISDDCMVLCITNNVGTPEIDEELFYGRVKKVKAETIKSSYQSAKSLNS